MSKEEKTEITFSRNIEIFDNKRTYITKIKRFENDINLSTIIIDNGKVKNIEYLTIPFDLLEEIKQLKVSN